MSVICLLYIVFPCSFARSQPGHTVRLATWQLLLFVISSFFGSFLPGGKVKHLAVSLGILSGSLPGSSDVYSKFFFRSYRLDFFSFSLPLSLFALWSSYPLSSMVLAQSGLAQSGSTCCPDPNWSAATAMSQRATCAKLPLLRRCLTQAAAVVCAAAADMQMDACAVASFMQMVFSSPFTQIISTTSPNNTPVASLGILSGSPLGSLASIFSCLQSAPFPFLFFFKKRIRPNRVASLGILSGSLPGSSCLPVPVGASLYSFCGAPPILPLCLFPYAITNSQFPPLNSFAFPVLLPFLSVSVV